MSKVSILSAALCVIINPGTRAQDLRESSVPAAVKTALAKNYAAAKKVSWEMEKGCYEANWGGKSGEDTSVQFSPAGQFVQIVTAIPVSGLPAPVDGYVKTHFKNAVIKEAGKGNDAAGTIFYEAEVSGKDLVFDRSGNFIKED